MKIRSVGLSQLWLQGFLDFVQELENGGPIEVEKAPEPMLAEEDMEGVIPRSSASSVQKVQLSAHLSQVEGPKGKAAKSKAKVKAEKPRPDDMRGLGPQVGDGATSPARAACKEEVRDASPRTNRSKTSKSGTGKAGQECSDIVSPEHGELDPEMQRVQNKLGQPFQVCLLSLLPERHLAGEKLGVARASAGASD